VPDAADVAAGLVVFTARAGVAGLRLALAPARLLARAPGSAARNQRFAEAGRAASERAQRRLEATVVGVLGSPAASRVVDAALAGPLPETVARSVVDQRVVERLAADPELVEATNHLVDRVIADPEFERAVERAVAGPVRKALEHQATSLAEEVGMGLRHRARSLDDAVGRDGEPGYGGAVSRAIGLAADLALVSAIVAVGGALVGLMASLVGELRPEWLVGVLLGAGWVLAAAAYFAFFWTMTGQTPGLRLLRMRVLGPGGRPPRAWRSLVRFAGLLLAIVPLFAGFLPVLFDRRRRGLHDLLAGTVVRAEPHGPAADDLTKPPALSGSAPPV